MQFYTLRKNKVKNYKTYRKMKIIIIITMVIIIITSLPFMVIGFIFKLISHSLKSGGEYFLELINYIESKNF